MRTLRPAAALAAASLVLIACGGGGDDSADTSAATTEAPTTTVEETTTTRRTTTTSPSTSTTTTLPEIIRQPLTGEPIDSEADIVQRAALAVKIDNAPAARRNHTGLGVADIVFEEIVEGSITRFAAVFHTAESNPVGPIRSGRTQDVDLLTSYLEPLFAWSGGNPGVTRAINESQLINLSPSRADGYYRGPGSAPHNLYNDTATLWAQTPPDQPGPPPQQFEYLRPEDEFGGGAVSGFELQMRGIDVEWQWDEESGRFLRSQEGGPHNDVVTGQIGATNVIVLVTDYEPSPVDARSPEAQTIGEGPLFVFSGGEVIGGTWKRDFNGFPFDFTDDEGNPIPINVGNTWVELAEWTNKDNPDFPPTPIALQFPE
ncbi:MAG: DUF3048 domain-containing protein [Ilumatobacteraceae bacterium]|nr:DUF3048 domain-containing protein [Ilumatobacteraceae bacterium]